MNSGSRNAQAYGFDISFLPKLSNTKANDGKSTLLHHLTEKIEQQFPECLKFPEDLHHLDAAARVSPETLGKNLTSMKSNIKTLEIDLKSFKPHNSLDRFGMVMSKFVEQARDQHEKLRAMFAKMERLYNGLADYFVFEPKKYTMDEFFGDIKVFKDQVSCVPVILGVWLTKCCDTHCFSLSTRIRRSRRRERKKSVD